MRDIADMSEEQAKAELKRLAEEIAKSVFNRFGI